MKRTEGLKAVFAKWQTTMILLGIYALAMAAVTILEAKMGTAPARAAIYNSWWFFVLHFLMILNFIAISRKQGLLRRKRWGSLFLHYGFVVIIVGAFITHVWGYEGYMHIREGDTAKTIVINNRLRDVPFEVTLKKFNLVRYPGSNTPSSYESDVIISHDGETKEQKIYMNNIARVGGFRIYQTSYDSDERGTILTVNSDRWGTAVTYVGYLMLLIGLIVALIQKGSRFRTLLSSLGKTAALVAIIICLSANYAKAQPSSMIREINPEHAQRFGRLLTQSRDGRIHPINTYSSEILRKVYHRNTYNGLSSDQVLISMIGNPHAWENVPMIYISVAEVARELGSDGKYIAYRNMFDPQTGEYRISERVTKIYQKEPNQRNKVEKEYLKLDEKVNILYNLFNGGMIPIFPTDIGWLSPADDVDGLSRMDSMMVKQVLPWYAHAMVNGDYTEATEAIEMIERYQAAKTAELGINPKHIEAELLYNKTNVFRYSFRLYLILGFVLAVSVLSAMRRKHTGSLKYSWWVTALTFAIIGVFLFQTFGIGLRWYISGRGPWANAYETMVYVGWIAVLGGLIFARRSRLVMALATMLDGVALFVANLNWLDPQITTLVPVLKSPWLMIHVSVITASYGFFGMCAMCGLASLCAILGGKDLPELRKINEIAMNIGLVLLTAGIFFGAVWANESWGRYWGWDPKETWALITMIVYAMITHSHFIPKINNSFALAAMSLAAISTVLMTFFGVNYYLSGLHSYGGSGEVSFVFVGIGTVVIIALILAAGYKYKRMNVKQRNT